MKKHSATVLILTLAGLTGLVNAQTGTTIIAHVPFNYIVNGKAMPAGESRVKVENNGSAICGLRATIGRFSRCR